MSRYQSFYAGPLLLCEYDFVEKQRKVPRCENSNCTAYLRPTKATPFCPECGQPMGEKVIPFQSESVDWDELDRQMKSTLTFVNNSCCLSFPEMTCTYIPNNYKGNPPPRDFFEYVEENQFFLSLDDVAVDAEMRWFETNYQDELVLLRQHFVKVRTTWAFIIYAG